METLLKQRRVKVTGPDRQKPEESSKSRLKRRVSFEEGDKRQNWFERQFSGQNREAYDNDSIDLDLAIAIAAAAFAIHSLEEEEDDREYQKKMRKRVVETSKSKNEDRRVEISRLPSSSNKKPTRRSSTKELAVAGEDSAKTLSAQEHDFSGTLNRVDVWEKTRIEKIKKRCAKLKSDVLSWENEKKKQAKRHMEAKQIELERRKSSNLQHYQNKIARIEQVAGGARAQVEEKRRNEEYEAKETAKKIRSTGKFPTRCLCF